MPYEVEIASMQIISGRVFMNKHEDIVRLFQRGLYPETHTSGLRVLLRGDATVDIT